MRNVTLSAEEDLIDAARERALSEKTTLNEAFRRWLASYAQAHKARQVDDTLAALRGRLTVGRKLTREEMNER
jgi:hypothetical protein